MIDFKQIKVIVLDVDGVLTDGGYYYSSGMEISNSVITKRFYTRDWYALEQVLKTNMHVMIMSQARDGCIGNKINYLKIHSRSLVWQNAFNSKHIHYHTEVDNKYAYIGEAQSTNISDYRDFYKWEYIAYIGDAENDLECMQKALYTGCPADAVPIIKEESNYICDAKGGYGAVYEFCMHILEKRNNI